MLGIRLFVSIASAVVGAIVALAVLLAVNRWIDVEVPGQVAVTMAVFALVRDLTADCLERWTLARALRRVGRLLGVHLTACLEGLDQPIPWSRLHHEVERLTVLPSEHRLQARNCLGELESYSAYASYARILPSFDMTRTRSLVDALASRSSQRAQ